MRVDEFMSIESYAHVHHIVSNVSGRLRADVDARSARCVRCFPGGTITGVPKVPLHADHRGARGHGRGRLHRLARLPRRATARMDINILIRTMTLSGGRT